MTVWIVLVPLASVVTLAAILGLAFDRRKNVRRRKPLLLRADTARARATVHYHVHVQDSISG